MVYSDEEAAEIGQQYFYGEKRKKNYKQAFPYLLQAAKAGEPHCQNLVGYCYHLGLGVEKNIKSAVRWYQRASSNDDLEALGNLALLNEKGIGVKPDLKKAFYL